MDAKKILDKVELKAGDQRARFSVSIDPRVFEAFKDICGKRPISAVIEELIREFNESAQGKKR